jgi:hypothetical protein
VIALGEGAIGTKSHLAPSRIAVLARERDALAAELATAKQTAVDLAEKLGASNATIATQARDAKAAASALAASTADRDAARKAVVEMEAAIASRDASIAAHVATIADRDATIAGNVATIADRDATIASNVATIADRDATIAGNVATIADRDATIAGNVATIADRDATIAGLRRELDAARSGAAAGGAGAAAAPAKPSLVDCELHADAVTFERTRRGDRIRIGKGSFGDVFAATFGDQPCVVKVPHVDGDPAAVPAVVQAAFWAEVRTQFLFRHPHIVALHGGYADVDPAGGGVVEVGAVMERCSGGTLEGRLHGAGAAPGPLKQRLTWASQVLSALAYLHAKDFIHADLKPENVLLEDGSPGARAKLSDFGLAKQRADSLASSTAVGSTYRKERGTPLYMDPRLMVAMTGARVAEADAGSLRKASDVYSAGVMLWELATGRVPFVDSLGGGSLAGVTKEGLYAYVVGGGRPATPEQLATLAPAGLGALIGRMWAARAEDRPTIVAAGEELARLVAGLGDA